MNDYLIYKSCFQKLCHQRKILFEALKPFTVLTFACTKTKPLRIS